jgi:hypothetical protein
MPPQTFGLSEGDLAMYIKSKYTISVIVVVDENGVKDCTFSDRADVPLKECAKTPEGRIAAL